MKKYAILLLSLLILNACESDDLNQYKLSTQANPPEGGTIFPSSGTFDEGEEIKFKAIPSNEYIFKNWSDDASGNENPMTTVMTDDMFVTANFEKKKYALNVEIWGEGTVKEEILQAKSTTDYPSGTTVQLTATPEEGWVFSGWDVIVLNIGTIQRDNPLVIQITSPVTVWAAFEPFDDQQVFVPDDNFEMALIELGLDDKLDDYVYAQRLRHVMELNLENREIEDLTGIEGFKELRRLNLTNNNLSSLDISNNWIERAIVLGNPSLTCVQTDKVQLNHYRTNYGEQVWLIADEGVTCTVDCSVSEEDKTFIPDDAFEQVLISLGLDTELDNYVRTIDIVNISELDLSGNNISDVTGIEDFKTLWLFDLSSNNLKSLDLTNLVPFKRLDARNNPLECIQVDPGFVYNQWAILDPPILADEGVEFELDCGY